jgi:hypothetical protein
VREKSERGTLPRKQIRSGRIIVGQSGTKLVATILLLALGLGVISWWYRYESAHRATNFWGPAAAAIISEPERIDWFVVADGEPGGRQYQDVTGAAGMVHLRHSLVSDRNYQWGQPIVGEDVNWRWGLRFADEFGQVWVLFDETFRAVGRQLEEGGEIRAIAATGMSETLQEYFSNRGFLAASTAD